MNIDRYQATDKDIDRELKYFKTILDLRLKRHGRGAFVSSHEGYGVCAEELKELLDEVQANDLQKVYSESIDLAVAAFWTALSISSGEKRKNIGPELSEIESDAYDIFVIDSDYDVSYASTVLHEGKLHLETFKYFLPWSLLELLDNIIPHEYFVTHLEKSHLSADECKDMKHAINMVAEYYLGDQSKFGVDVVNSDSNHCGMNDKYIVISEYKGTT